MDEDKQNHMYFVFKKNKKIYTPLNVEKKKKGALISNKKTYKSKNLTGKGKYIVKVVD